MKKVLAGLFVFAPFGVMLGILVKSMYDENSMFLLLFPATLVWLYLFVLALNTLIKD